LDYESPTPTEITDFRNALLKVNKAVMLRNSKGDDIAAACGQLAYLNYNSKG
jgi:adenine C2-methylase RlmN of 23S rRNA A2503 and tRNA A37